MEHFYFLSTTYGFNEQTKVFFFLQWARDEFEGLFRNPADTANQYICDPKFMERTLKLNGSEPMQTLEGVYETLVRSKPNDFSACVKWARLRFEVSEPFY